MKYEWPAPAPGKPPLLLFLLPLAGSASNLLIATVIFYSHAYRVQESFRMDTFQIQF